MTNDAWADKGWIGSEGSSGVPEMVVKPLVQPPVRYLVVATVMVFISLALLPVTLVSTHVVGYIAGSLITVGLLALYTAVDKRYRLSAWYSAKPEQQKVRPYIAGVGVAVAAIHAWYIAVHFAS